MFTHNQSRGIEIEYWFIPVDVIMIICTGFVIFVSLIVLLITMFDKTNRTISMILLWNSLIAEMVFACVMCSMAIFSFENDRKQIEYEDCLCIFRGYMSYAISAVRSHSYFLHSIYRYMIILHPSNRYFQSQRFQLCLIIFTWFISLIHPFPFLLTNQIEYNFSNQVCHIPFEKPLSIFYTCLFAYLNPLTMIAIIYLKLVQYIRRMNQLITPVNQYLRIQREFVMVRRIVMLLSVLITLGLPYTIFFLMSFFTSPPRYYFRWAFLSVDVSLACVIVVLLQFSDSIKQFWNEFVHRFSSRKLIKSVYERNSRV